MVFEPSHFFSFLPSYFQIKNVQNRKFDLYFLCCKTFPSLPFVWAAGLFALLTSELRHSASLHLFQLLCEGSFRMLNVSSPSLSAAMAMTGPTPCSSMSNHTKERVTMTKVTLENFYSNLIAQHEEREMRYESFLLPFQSGQEPNIDRPQSAFWSQSYHGVVC